VAGDPSLTGRHREDPAAVMPSILVTGTTHLVGELSAHLC
jgi:hypothetical protein